jgi:hypothetical protein
MKARNQPNRAINSVDQQLFVSQVTNGPLLISILGVRAVEFMDLRRKQYDLR